MFQEGNVVKSLFTSSLTLEEGFISIAEILHQFSSTEIPLDDQLKEHLEKLFMLLCKDKSAINYEQFLEGTLKDEYFHEILETEETRGRSNSQKHTMAITFGHPLWDLAESMMFSIREATLNFTPKSTEDIEASDYTESCQGKIERFFIVFLTTEEMPFGITRVMLQ